MDGRPVTAAERLAARLGQALHLLSVTEEALEKAQARIAELENTDSDDSPTS